jgi:hypothetical protein
MSEFLATVVRYLYDTVMLALLIGWLGLAAVFVIGIIALPFVKRAKCDTWPCPCRIETGTGGFEPWEDGWRCDRCGRTFGNGREAELDGDELHDVPGDHRDQQQDKR